MSLMRSDGTVCWTRECYSEIGQQQQLELRLQEADCRSMLLRLPRALLASWCNQARITDTAAWLAYLPQASWCPWP